ncbi:hypothetical protein GCM10020256_11240 [Streptomyces thermocoprophilus]
MVGELAELAGDLVGQCHRVGGAGWDMLLRVCGRSVVVALPDALRLVGDGFRAGAGQWGGAVGAGRDAGA